MSRENGKSAPEVFGCGNRRRGKKKAPKKAAHPSEVLNCSSSETIPGQRMVEATETWRKHKRQIQGDGKKLSGELMKLLPKGSLRQPGQAVKS